MSSWRTEHVIGSDCRARVLLRPSFSGIKELTDDGIDLVGMSERSHVPAPGDGAEGPVRTGFGENLYDFANWAASRCIAYQQRPRSERHPLVDSCFLFHDGIPLMKVGRQRVHERAAPFLRHGVPVSIS